MRSTTEAARRLMRAASLAVCALFAGVLLQHGASASDERDYLLATASTGGTYYPVGVAIGALTKVKLQPGEGLSVSAINSAGSAENIKLMGDGEVQFAILQGLFGHEAWTGTGRFSDAGPQEALRSVTLLWRNVEQFIVRSADAKTGTVADLANLKGKGFALGSKNSGTLGSNTLLLTNLGHDVEADFKLFYAGYGASGEALQDGRISGFSAPAGVPTGAVSSVFANLGDKVTLLSFTPEQAALADGGLGLWSTFTIPAGTYAGQTDAVSTIAQPNFLAVRADVSDDDVYLITKAIYENLPFLHGIHKATRDMSLETAIAGLPVPLHPGAARYFAEAGLEVGPELAAP